MTTASLDRIYATQKERFTSYFVEYHPPRKSDLFAFLNLTFLEKQPLEEVAASVESETRRWLERYPFPIFASAFDSFGDSIDLTPIRDESVLMALPKRNLQEPQFVWGLLSNSQLEPYAATELDLAQIYSDIPSTTGEERRVRAEKDQAAQRRGIYLIAIWVAVVPGVVAFFEFFAPQWIGAVLVCGSLWKALDQYRKMTGKRKPTLAETKKEAEEAEMRHHHYHCKVNPEAFQRLKLENFDRWAHQSILSEADQIALQEHRQEES